MKYIYLTVYRIQDRTILLELNSKVTSSQLQEKAHEDFL